MNKVWSIISALFFAAVLCGCNSAEDENLKQRDDIVSYLKSKHTPKLIAESEVPSSLNAEPAFYSTTGRTTFRYIEDYYNADRESKATIKKGSEIEIVISLYDFSSMATPSTSTILFSNDATQIDELKLLYDHFTSAWSTEPISLSVGSGALFGGVETLLVGCKEGDVLEFYMTLDEGYGSSIVGVATVDSPLALFCKVLTVNN